MPSAASDLALIVDAARAAGAIARARFGETVQIWSKGAAGPVTEVDLELDRLLEERLRGARPDYGWLSEETLDTPDRLGRARVFVVDPIDGTQAFIEGVAEFCISIGLVENGRAIAGAVYNPLTEEMFAGGETIPATLNGAPVRVSVRDKLEGAHLVGRRRFYSDPRWRVPWPPLTVSFRHSIAYRMALIAAGRFDGAVFAGFKNEWDIAAGCAIITAAGGLVTDPWGAPAPFNAPDPRAPGIVAAGPALHPEMIARTRILPHPSHWAALQTTPPKLET
ncbi:MAG: 3'(2'),5'-bisphosphate nucleotidase CysQ [Hyphomonadaceae bacterium]|nr:3'(2'),5'-bisphosphate nucleotidase CysQ [Hyphomonadaceae bacterium]